MYKRTNYPRRRVFILDELAIIIALFAALFIRHPDKFLEWYGIYDGLYVSLMVTLCLFHVIVFLLYDNRRKPIFEQDPVENLLSVIKSRCILVAMSLLYLYVVQKSKQSSRIIVGLFFAFSIALGYVFRMLYRRHHLRRHGNIYLQKMITITPPYPDVAEFLALVNDGHYDAAIIIDSSDDIQGRDRIIATAEKYGIRTYCTMDSMGYTVRPEIISDVGEYAAIPAFVRKEKFSLFGVNYSIARTEEAVLHVIKHIMELGGRYICFSNVHTLVMARENEEYGKTLNDAAYTFPDGNPIAILQRKDGIFGAERVAGPDFMEHMFRDTQDGSISHFFYGSSQETLNELRINLENKYPGIVIKGMYSPPFRELTPEEDQADVDMINASGADIIWVGLGAPKQEMWMRAHQSRIKGVMMGVGAGFDFHAGTIKRAPIWVRRIGLEWLYRLFQDPGRLIKRYVVTNAKFFWYLCVDAISKRGAKL